MSGEKQPLLASQEKPGLIKTNRAKAIFEGYVQPCCAELLGTALYVYLAGMVRQNELLLATAIGSGLAFSMLVYSLGALSGGHFNPVVTLGVLLCGGLPLLLAPLYVASQLCGAILGAALTMGVLSFEGNVTWAGEASAGESVYSQILGGASNLQTTPGYSTTVASGILSEAIFTYLLVTVYLVCAVDSKTRSPMFGLAIGLAVTAGVIGGGPVTSGCMNPARALGPAVVAGTLRPEVWESHYVFWVGPVVGALVAALIYRLVLASEDRRLFCK